MIRALFVILLLSTLLLFGLIQWGSQITTDKEAIPQTLQADRILLLPTAISPTDSPVSAASTVGAVSLPVSGPAAVCMEWGDFSGDNLKRAAEALSALSLRNRLTQRQIEHTNGYWVYMAPRESRAEVDRKIAELKALGIKDYYVMQDGKWQNAISLGIFKTSEAAQKFLESIMAQGVRTARVGERVSTVTATTFILDGLDAAAAARMDDLQKRFAGSALKTVACAN
ncbi:MAG: SPOR domain-containing protein [Pseudomonadota bacterium]